MNYFSFVKNQISQKTRKYSRRILSSFIKDNGGDHRDTIFLSSLPRAGSTIVSEVITAGGNYRLMFEPFHPQKLKIAEPFGWLKYLNAEDDDPTYLEAAKKILSGKVRHPFIDADNHQLVFDKRLIKEVRSSYFLGWLHHHFPEMPIILLIRNPITNSISIMNQGWGRSDSPVTLEPGIKNKYFPDMDRHHEAVDSYWKRSIHFWCIRNIVSLKQLQPDKSLVVCYENMLVKPNEEIKRIADFLGIETNDKFFKALKKPSMTSSNFTDVMTGKKFEKSWKSKISPEQEQQARDILKIYSIEDFYPDLHLPNLEAISKFIGQDYQ